MVSDAHTSGTLVVLVCAASRCLRISPEEELLYDHFLQKFGLSSAGSAAMPRCMACRAGAMGAATREDDSDRPSPAKPTRRALQTRQFARKRGARGTRGCPLDCSKLLLQCTTLLLEDPRTPADLLPRLAIPSTTYT